MLIEIYTIIIFESQSSQINLIQLGYIPDVYLLYTAARHSLTIRSKVTLNRILEITNNSMKIETNEEGTITGRYTGT
jgi:hypothetical protein